MKKALLAGVAVLVLTGSGAVYAQHRGFDAPWRHHHSRINPEDRAAFVDARIAAVKAGLKLTPDQERLWPPLETAVRDFARLRIDRANARMQSRDNRRDDDRRGPRDEARRDDRGPDREFSPVDRLRERADRMGETAAALKTIAETADPLYKTLDDGQKRRLGMLTRLEGRFGGGMGGGGWHRGGFERGIDRGLDRDGDSDRDDRGAGGGRDHQRDRGAGPDRL